MFPSQNGLLLGIWVAAFPLCASAHAQEPIQLKTDAVAVEGRTYVSAVHELRDGRLVVVDMLEKSVLLYDRDLTLLGTIGRNGQGPREYSAPKGLAPLPDGRILIQDPGNGRFVALDPDGSPNGEVILGSDLPQTWMINVGDEPPAIDSLGRWYFMRPGLFQGGFRDGVRIDSVRIARWSGEIGERAIDVASAPKPALNQGAIPLSQMGATVARPTSDWAACPNGLIYIALPDPYGVIIHFPDGELVQGPEIPYTPARPTEAFKQKWAEEVARRPASALRTRPGGGREVGYWFGGTPFDVQWPEQLPPFSEGAAECGPYNRAWIRRTTEDRSPRVDVFDSRGNRVQRFDLPDGSRIVGFGPESVYVVVRDEVDLEYITRLNVPGG